MEKTKIIATKIAQLDSVIALFEKIIIKKKKVVHNNNDDWRKSKNGTQYMDDITELDKIVFQLRVPRQSITDTFREE